MNPVCELIRAAMFRSKRRGYDMVTVDELLSEIETLAEAGRPFSHLLFPELPVSRRGYRQEEVDALLSELRMLR